VAERDAGLAATADRRQGLTDILHMDMADFFDKPPEIGGSP
jgi:hypothetical protein